MAENNIFCPIQNRQPFLWKLEIEMDEDDQVVYEAEAAEHARLTEVILGRTNAPSKEPTRKQKKKTTKKKIVPKITQIRPQGILLSKNQSGKCIYIMLFAYCT